MVVNSSQLGLLLGVVVNLFSAGTRGAEDEKLAVLQPQTSISVLRGEDFKLECQVSSLIPAGPVKWFMGNGQTRKLIYSEIGSFARVTRIKPDSDKDFTISIHNFVPEDAGTYYCVKQKKKHRDESDFQSGRGTKVVVRHGVIIPVAAGTSAGILLAVLFSVALYFYIKKKRGKKPCPSRPESPLPEDPITPHQTMADKEIVYVDVKHSSGVHRPKQSKPEDHSTYATIR